MSSISMTWKKALLNESATIKDAIKCLDQAAMKIALVVNSELKLTGTISDGDIRRGLLRGLNMDSPIGLVLHGNPFVVNPEINRETVLQLMKANKIQQIPVVDHEGHVLGLHLWDDVCLPKARSNTMIIMAGGKGTRLRPYTENCPKPMLPVAGRPMLEHIIERAVHNGFNHFILAVHYLGHMVEEYFGDGKKFNVSIEYLREQAPLGTAGALSLLEQKPTEPIVVTNGDVLTDLNYAELLDFHLMHQASATMAVRTHEWQHPFGVVQTKGVDITGFEEKPISRTHINAGVYVLDPISLDSLDNACHCDMPTLFERLQLKGLRTVAYPMHEPWLDVGRPADYESAQRSAE